MTTTSKLRMLALGGAAAFAMSASSAPSFAQEDAAPASCDPSGALAYVCGVTNGEDIVHVPGTKWLIASSITSLGGGGGPGQMYLIDSEAKTAEQLFPGASPAISPDAAMYPGCGPIDLAAFDTHGLALRETSAGHYRLYATSHGAVEAIQAWTLDATGDKPVATWVGCVELPAGTFANSVAITADGGFVTTKFMDPTDPQAFPKIQAGEVNGVVYRWVPGGAVEAIAGTELSGPNGIELSPDDRWMFVAAFGGHSVVRFDLTGAEAPASVAVDVTPDNLRWTDAGTLLTAGGNLEQGTGWSVYEIDTNAMTAARIGGAGADAAIQGASTALKVGDSIWVGTFGGDRLAYFPAP